jgi:predicted RNA-binding Zn-ribbon protein involved in translation (DUF1610 family)
MMQRFQCPVCGNVSLVGDTSCRACGEFFTYNCPSCNYFVNRENNNCPNCYTVIYWGNPPVKTSSGQLDAFVSERNIPGMLKQEKTGSPSEKDSIKKRRFKYLLWLFLALVCMLLIGAVLLIDRILNIR